MFNVRKEKKYFEDNVRSLGLTTSLTEIDTHAEHRVVFPFYDHRKTAQNNSSACHICLLSKFFLFSSCCQK